jgi:membrane protease YdiL (CAAX protease family)
MLAAVREEWRRFWSELRPAPVVVCWAGALGLWLDHYFGSRDFFTAHLQHYFSPQLSNLDLDQVRCLYWCFSPLVSLVLWPRVALAVTLRLCPNETRPEGGFRLGQWRIGLMVTGLFYLVALVLVAIVSHTNDFRDMYPLCPAARHSLPRMLIYEVAFFLYFLSWESFFRGYLLFGLEPTFRTWAVFIQMLPFVVVHFDKPVLEALSSAFGGVALGYLALRTRSFVYGAFIHAAMAISLDIFVISSVGFH